MGPKNLASILDVRARARRLLELRTSHVRYRDIQQYSTSTATLSL